LDTLLGMLAFPLDDDGRCGIRPWDLGKCLDQIVEQAAHRRQQPASRGEDRVDDARLRRPARDDFNQGSRRQIVIDSERRQLGDADAAQRREPHLNEVVGDQSGPMRHHRAFAVGSI